MEKLRIQTKERRLHQDKHTTKIPPLLGLQGQRWEVVFPESIQWELGQEGGFQEGMGPQKEKLPMGPKILEQIWLLLLPQKHKRLSFRIRESQVQLQSDSSQPHPVSLFLVLACNLIHLPHPQRHLWEESFPAHSPKEGSNPPMLIWASGPYPLGLGIMAWGVRHHKTKWPRETCFLSTMKTQRLKMMTNCIWIAFQVLLSLTNPLLHSLT